MDANEIEKALRFCGSAKGDCDDCSLDKDCKNRIWIINISAECIAFLRTRIAELEAEVDRLQAYETATLRLGDFGKLFLEYTGCPRGAYGRMGQPGGASIPNYELLAKEVLAQPSIRDVDGGEWIPAHADALREIVGEYKLQVAANAALQSHDKEAMELLEAAIADIDTAGRELGWKSSGHVWRYNARYEALKAQSTAQEE